MRVRVAIDLALDKLFTYEVPQELEKKLVVGQLLSVPFGPRTARGFALALEEEPGEKTAFELKNICSIVDPNPFFSPTMLELVKWIANYTASPIETVLHTALPASILKPGARAKTRTFVTPLTEGKTGRLDLTTKQAWTYEQIIRLSGGWQARLLKELKVSAGIIKALEQKGYVTLEERQVHRDPLLNTHILPSKALALNEEQQAALDAILSPDLRPVLLHGVTGAGKTEVYLQAIAATLKRGKDAIVLVPEISLTPQTVRRFASRFGKQIAVLHSALSDGERYDEWHRIRNGEARVVIGPRSAIFAPVHNLGLIVVDEEHETSYKQDKTPRYHARDFAVMRGFKEHAKVVLGSATPSLESRHNVEIGKYVGVTIRKRAGAGTLPTIHIVDMNEPENTSRIFSRQLIDALFDRLAKKEQSILFLNRRGFSRSVTCNACHEVITCPNCDIPYTYHRADNCLRCHVCGEWIPTPTECPACHSKDISFKGIGTQRAESALKDCFPQARVLRMDADSTSGKNSHDDILGQFRRHEADILLGTQMIAKGLDFPNVTLVGVLNADSSLGMPDFRASERTFQLLAQVSGRAGRAELPGEAYIQTYQPDESTIRLAAAADYDQFAQQEMELRQQGGYPPFCHLAIAAFHSKTPDLVEQWSLLYAESLRKIKGLQTSDAMPSALEKADGWYRWQIILRAPKALEIVRAWRWIRAKRPVPTTVRAFLDVDAYDLT